LQRNNQVAILLSGSITYRVSKKWLKNENAEVSDIQFLKYKGGWKELSSEIKDEDEDYYYFSIKLDSFSLFAVVVKTETYTHSVSIPEIPESTPKATPTPDLTPEVTETPEPVSITLREERGESQLLPIIGEL